MKCRVFLFNSKNIFSPKAFILLRSLFLFKNICVKICTNKKEFLHLLYNKTQTL